MVLLWQSCIEIGPVFGMGTTDINTQIMRSKYKSGIKYNKEIEAQRLEGGVWRCRGEVMTATKSGGGETATPIAPNGPDMKHKTDK